METLAGRDGQVYLVAAARTPIGKMLGAFASLSGVDLGAVAIKGALERAVFLRAALGQGAFPQGAFLRADLRVQIWERCRPL